jgi:hypothetical protein
VDAPPVSASDSDDAMLPGDRVVDTPVSATVRSATGVTVPAERVDALLVSGTDADGLTAPISDVAATPVSAAAAATSSAPAESVLLIPVNATVTSPPPAALCGKYGGTLAASVFGVSRSELGFWTSLVPRRNQRWFSTAVYSASSVSRPA